MVQWQDYDAGTQAHVLGTRGQGGEGDRWGGAVAVLAEVVFGWPDGVEAELLGAHHDIELLVDDLLLRAPHRVLEQVQLTKLHA